MDKLRRVNTQEESAEVRPSEVRRSKRANKGVPPKRFTENDDKEVHQVLNEVRENMNVQMFTRKEAEKNVMRSQSVNLGESKGKILAQNKSRSEVFGDFSRNSEFRGSISKISKAKSKSSVLHHELEILQLKKKYENEESREKLRLIQKMKEIELKELELKTMLDEEDDTTSEERSASIKLYEDHKNVRKWLENGATENQTNQKSNLVAKPIILPVKEEEANNMFLEVARQCAENTKLTTKLWERQKMKELPYFSGEITEWPLFINEYRRSTETFNLNDYENLLRLDRSLKGRARDTVKALLISPDNVPKIIKMLELNFGRADWIVLNLMEKVKKFGCIKEDKIESCISFSNVVNNLVVTMKNINSMLYLYNPELLASVVEKLPSIQKYNWGKFKHQKDSEGVPTSLEDFASWYEEEIGSLAAVWNPVHRNKYPFKREAVMTQNVKIPDEVCVICQDSEHKIWKCKKFIEKSIEDRRKIVSDLKLCFSCLGTGHNFKRCSRKRKCGISGCQGKHNRLVHLDRQSNHQEYQAISRSTSPNFCANLVDGKETVLLRVAPVVLRGPKFQVETFALFDEGSTCSLIEEDLANYLELAGSVSPLCFQWTNEITHFEDTSRNVCAEISGITTNSLFYKVKNLRTVKNLSLPQQKFNTTNLCEKYQYIEQEILEKINDVKPQLLLGQDNGGLIVPRQVIQPRLNQPIMSKSKLGWTLHGVINGKSDVYSSEFVNLCCAQNQDDELHELVKSSFKLEDFGVKIKGNVVKSLEDEKALEIMNTTLRYNGSRFEIGHLYKNHNVTFPRSETIALKRLSCMERKMKKDEEFARQYKQKMQEYINKGYARKLEHNEVTNNPRDWYLPHFAVWNINKPGKIRLVFDAAAKTSGVSLNDLLLQGPDFVPSLVSVLLRFRQGRIAFVADIKEMFHQVLIRSEDRCSQRFFWREYEHEKPRIFEMNAMIFGAVSSPSVAQFVKNRNSERFEQKFPGISKIVKRQHYVDDYLDSCNTEKDAIDRIKQVIFVHKQGGFEIVKWVSNSHSVTESIPEPLRADLNSCTKIDTEKFERVLGLVWAPVDDSFVFNSNLKKIDRDLMDGTKNPTKREVLRITMSIFDPLGFLAPLIIQARILLQDIWKSNIEWDQELPEDLSIIWKRWLEEFHAVVPVKIKRYYFPNLMFVEEVSLHIFSDASERAYAAVAFLRCGSDGKNNTSFIFAKYKVAEINQQTVPKLELQGAVLAVRLAKLISSEIEYKIKNIHYWSDSLVVLKQIRSKSRRFPMFTACRLGEIHENSEISQWHWVPSDLNVADLATKVQSNIYFKSNTWLMGPDFLQKNEEFWPREPESLDHSFIHTENANEKKIFIVPDEHRFSKWLRLLRATAWILHFVGIVKKKFKQPFLDSETVEEAHKRLILKCQNDSFQEELQVLKKKKLLSKNSRLYKLSPFMDDYGVLRMKGRFSQSNLLDIELDVKFPIILDPRHKITMLIINHYHERNEHLGVETVTNELRTRYWILHIRAAVKKCFKECQACKIRKCYPVTPEMAPLPEERLTPFVYPFTYVGVDYFGPMTVSVGRRIEKRYGALFTCLTTRAIHVEIAATLDTSSFILALRRFMCRRGQPLEIFSDNGTNFVGAEKELKKCLDELDQIEIIDDLSNKGVSWKFNPPAAPHMGGIWERMVRSVKNALRIVLKSVNPKEEVLQTLLAEVEYMVNARPLTHVSIDPNDPEPITPNHFLLLRPGDVKIFGNINNNYTTRKQWCFAQNLANSFWRRWIIEYRQTLVKRQKWHSSSEPVEKGGIVVMVDEKAPRNEWLLGRIREVFPGKDGVVRVVSVDTKKGQFMRPVSKLCVLPVNGEDPKASRVGGC